jgi:protein-L-isoaspartate(D-aspartate) O-methyltransferase
MSRSPAPPARFPLGLDRVQPRSAASRPGADTLLRPQRPLQQAAVDQSRQSAPSGLGLDSAVVRHRMVQRLRAGGLRCEPVLQALAAVERHRFVDSALATQAYEDTSLPIGLSQTISKPSVVGWMLALLFEGASAQGRGHLGRVLEIGTGCGYQAALLMQVSRSLVSIERLQPLHEKAAANLADLRSGSDLRLVFGDGMLGHAPRAPYDSIIAAAGGEQLPAAWLAQLAPGGRLVAPVQRGGGQRLVVVDHATQGLVTHELEAVQFVPLKSGVA